MIINCDNQPSTNLPCTNLPLIFVQKCMGRESMRTIYKRWITLILNWPPTVLSCPLSSVLSLVYFRYVDIVLGLSFLVSHLVLMHSSKHESRSHLTLYFVFSVSTLILYWAWFVYLKYAMGESEASKEVNMWWLTGLDCCRLTRFPQVLIVLMLNCPHDHNPHTNHSGREHF